MQRILLVLFLTLLMITSLNARKITSYEDSACQFFPDNKLHYPKELKSANISESLFRQYLETFKKIAAPKIKANYQKELLVEGDWEESRVNAFATRDADRNPIISVTGGLARHPLMTRDALFVILCHELGHQFGGAPKKFRGRTNVRSWSSAEGQADYYAATRCLPHLFEKLNESSYLPMSKNDFGLSQVCETDICRRITIAAHRVAQVFYDVRPQGRPPKIDSKDTSEVWMTIYDHPIPQCRLDTFISGANCDVILDKAQPFDDKDASIGACYSENPTERAGPRPLCWFSQENY